MIPGVVASQGGAVWVYHGTSGTPNMTISYGGSGSCPGQAEVIAFLTTTYPPQNYAVGYLIRVNTNDGSFPPTTCDTWFFRRA
jgi:hypothetical protein